MMKFSKALRVLAVSAIALAAVACSGGGGGGSPAPAPVPTPTPTPSGPVQISGTITFDFVPFNTATNGLNYALISQRPARGVVVEALDSGGSVLTSTVTDAAGGYAVTVNGNTNVRIRARARLLKSTSGTWDVTARDNTSGNAIYVLDGALADSGSSNSTRNLNAPSGWTGAGYGGTRAAAPFAILDVIYGALDQVLAVRPGTNFTPAQVYWSINNRAVDGMVANGEIGTTSYTRIMNVPTILVLGNENVDTDEYDTGVIAHELGHYVEDTLARSDSIGGEHSLSQQLDPRLANSEGWGNAFSSMVRNDPFYRDSSGAQQSTGFSINVETNTGSSTGWYSERSDHSIVYDVFDAAADGADTINAGLGPVIAALTSAAYAQGDALTSIYAFEAALRAQGISGTGLDALLNAQNIIGRTPIATGETNAGAVAMSLPVFRQVVVGAAPIMICSIDDQGTFNKLGNRVLMRFTIPATQSLTFTMTRVSGPTGRDPDFIVYLRGVEAAAGESSNADSETLVRSLSAGTYFIDAYDFLNVSDTGPSGDVCFNFSIV